MRALTAMLCSNLCLYRDVRIVGAVPGVLVGDVFNYRAELIIVGLHSRTQAAIGYVPASLVSEGHPVATSIVSSGEYLDDRDRGDLLVYTGSGRRPRNDGEQNADQAFDRGNLALAYSCKYGVEVRVVRCHDCNASPSGKLYVYDGLYKVEYSTHGHGKSGREVSGFNLVRLPGQDPPGSNAWRDDKKLTDALDSHILPPGYLTLDLSRGKETVRVPVCNTVDQDRSPLDDTAYLARPEFPARWKEWGDASAAVLPDFDDEGPPLFPQCPEPAYVLDVSKRRNLASYICHSTAPNTFVQFVVRGNENESCPHLAVFAMEIIPPMGELSIDYGID